MTKAMADWEETVRYRLEKFGVTECFCEEPAGAEAEGLECLQCGTQEFEGEDMVHWHGAHWHWYCLLLYALEGKFFTS